MGMEQLSASGGQAPLLNVGQGLLHHSQLLALYYS